MREEIEKLIVESYECGNISLEEANILMETRCGIIHISFSLM